MQAKPTGYPVTTLACVATTKESAEDDLFSAFKVRAAGAWGHHGSGHDIPEDDEANGGDQCPKQGVGELGQAVLHR